VQRERRTHAYTHGDDDPDPHADPDGDEHPVCPVCKEIYEGLREPQDGDKNEGGKGSGGGRKWGFGRNPGSGGA